jgi:hypothetical protein
LVQELLSLWQQSFSEQSEMAIVQRAVGIILADVSEAIAHDKTNDRCYSNGLIGVVKVIWKGAIVLIPGTYFHHITAAVSVHQRLCKISQAASVNPLHRNC